LVFTEKKKGRGPTMLLRVVVVVNRRCAARRYDD
jgi:hypothetical protein